MQRLDLFKESIRSKATLDNYSRAIKFFQTWADIPDLRKLKSKAIEEKLTAYVIHLKNKGMSYTTQNMVINAVQKFCEAYDIDVRFKRIRKFTSEQDNKREDQPYSTEQIRHMVEVCDIRRKAMILIFTSTGIRLGAMQTLRLKDLVKNESGIYKVTVYAQSQRSKYYTFMTTESTKAVDDYLEYRKRRGEIPYPDSPVIREEFALEKANSPKSLKPHSISKLIFDLQVKVGLRKIGERSATAIVHGFRKGFNTALVKAGVKPVIVEMLMGHKIGIQAHYLRLSEEEVLQEYLKAVDLLTVSNEKVLQMEVEALKIETADMNQLKKNYLDLKLENADIRKELAEVKNYTVGEIFGDPNTIDNFHIWMRERRKK